MLKEIEMSILKPQASLPKGSTKKMNWNQKIAGVTDLLKPKEKGCKNTKR